MTLKGINADTNRLIKIFTKTEGKVFGRFLMEVVSGIITSQSVNLSKISRAIEADAKTTARQSPTDILFKIVFFSDHRL